MLCLFLGEDYAVTNGEGEQIVTAEYAFHFQTQWRFTENNEILLASGDVREPYSENVPEDWQYDLVGRPDEESSVFDVRAKELMNRMQGSVVVDCRLSPANDVTIVFSNGVFFQQFMSASRNREEWRLIDRRNDIHVVCYDEDGNISRE